jgi:hypothetical protein
LWKSSSGLSTFRVANVAVAAVRSAVRDGKGADSGVLRDTVNVPLKIEPVAV